MEMLGESLRFGHGEIFITFVSVSMHAGMVGKLFVTLTHILLVVYISLFKTWDVVLLILAQIMSVVLKYEESQ